MNENFDLIFEKLIGHEGGYTTNRADRGNWTSGTIGVGSLKGTKYGISAMAYPSLNIKDLTLEQAKAIYAKDYWLAIGADQVPSGVDYLVFDIAVNHGTDRARKWLQTAVGATPDGVIGPKTLLLIQGKAAIPLIKRISTIRAQFYIGISTLRTFGNGWMARLVETTVDAIEMSFLEPALDQSKAAQDQSLMDNWFRRI